MLAEQSVDGSKCRLDDGLAPNRQLHPVQAIGIAGSG